MKFKLLNYVICPKCRGFPLEINIFNKEYINRRVQLPPCDTYCGYHQTYIKELKIKPNCKECLKTEIKEGYLRCPDCKEWYPIIDTILIMLLDELRPKKVVEDFIETYKEILPEDIVKNRTFHKKTNKN